MMTTRIITRITTSGVIIHFGTPATGPRCETWVDDPPTGDTSTKWNIASNRLVNCVRCLDPLGLVP